MEDINLSSSLDKTNNLNNNNSLNNNSNFDISLKNPIHILNYHKYSIYCLSILNDGKFQNRNIVYGNR